MKTSVDFPIYCLDFRASYEYCVSFFFLHRGQQGVSPPPPPPPKFIENFIIVLQKNGHSSCLYSSGDQSQTTGSLKCRLGGFHQNLCGYQIMLYLPALCAGSPPPPTKNSFQIKPYCVYFSYIPVPMIALEASESRHAMTHVPMIALEASESRHAMIHVPMISF